MPVQLSPVTGPRMAPSASHRAVQLAICILGIYVFFLTWGVLQERISTLDYASRPVAAFGHSSHPTQPSHPALQCLVDLFHALASWKDAVSVSIVHAILHLVPSLAALVEEPISSGPSAPALAALNRNKFDYFIVLNLSQCLAATVIGLLLVSLLRPSTPKKQKASSSSSSSSSSATKQTTKEHSSPTTSSTTIASPDPFPALSPKLLLAYLKIAITYCCASPFGYASLKHIDYVTMNLGKSCKLLPVLLLSLVVRKSHKGRAIETSKIIGVLLITLGVTGFMLFDEGKRVAKSSSLKAQDPSLLAAASTAASSGSLGNASSFSSSSSSSFSSASATAEWLLEYASSFIAWFGSHSLYGVCLLFMNLVLDGATNTWQDEIFHHYKVSSLHMMFHMNWLSSGLMLLYLCCWPWTTELSSAGLFLLRHPQALGDLILFALCGALGQAFVFYTIENFGALSLVTVTVTRKLFTILLSVIYFGHVLNLHQWLCVAVVFGALVMETIISLRKRKKQHQGKAAVEKSSSTIATTTSTTTTAKLPKSPVMPPLTSSAASAGPVARATRQAARTDKPLLDATLLAMPSANAPLSLKKAQ